MNIADLDYFLAVVEHRSIGRAADALGLSQPAMTRAVARLESYAGQPLFTRHPKGVLPTPAGEALARRAQRIRIEQDDAARELHQIRTGQSGLLSAGYSPSVPRGVLARAIRGLLDERPSARLRLAEMLMEDLLDNLTEGSLELAIGPVPSPLPAELLATLLYRDSLWVVADRSHPLRHRERVRLQDIAAQPWLLPAPHIPARSRLDRIVAEAGLPPLNVRIESPVVSQNQLGLIAGSDMLSLSVSGAQRALDGIGLARVMVEDLDMGREIGLIRRSGGYVSPLAMRFEELLLAALARRGG